MCIIVHKAKGVKLDEIVYRNCYNRNDHGVGIAFVDDGQLKVIKGMMGFDEMYAIVKANEERELLIHYRVMSKGAISEENCHPFVIPPGMHDQYSFALMHNGTLNWRSTDQKSDTHFFVEDALGPLLDRDPYFFDYPFCRRMMEHFIGSNNKFAIMRCNSQTKESNVYIVNAKEGIYYEGCWFSNMSFTDESSRTVFQNDQKRIENWKPKLYVEPKTVHQMHNNHLFDDGYYRTSNTKAPYTPPKGPWAWCPYGYGWHNTDEKYKGSRDIAAYNEWKIKNAGLIKIIDEKGKKNLKPGLSSNIVPKDQLDPMHYLTAQEEKVARRECLRIVSDIYPQFSPKHWSTMELAARARAEFRDTFPEYEGLSNQQLMQIIITGDDEGVFANPTQN